MALGANSSDLSISKNHPGLIFDADAITLVGRYGNELAAYRARKCWTDVFQSYFLLECGRDYEMSIARSPERGYDVLSCFFTSACGRYAFWRLINDQAPEAELKLVDTNPVGGRTSRRVLESIWPGDNTPLPSVWGGSEGHGRSLWSRFLGLFRS